MIAFKDFIEDYNTATMPHDKYYNLEIWEMNEYRKAQIQKMNKTGMMLIWVLVYPVYNDLVLSPSGLIICFLCFLISLFNRILLFSAFCFTLRNIVTPREWISIPISNIIIYSMLKAH